MFDLNAEEMELLERYLAGETTAEDEIAIRGVLDARPKAHQFLAAVRDELRAIDINPMAPQDQNFVTNAAWERVSARLAGRPRVRHTPQMQKAFARDVRPRAFRWQVAAALLIAVGATALYAGYGLWRNAPTPPEMREIATKRGQRANVYLSDGTHVVLGPTTTLRFPTSWENTRDVYLSGQGYFEVATDPRRRFLVHTAVGVAEDLGTAFTIRQFVGDTTVVLVVTDGAVLLAPHDSAVGVTLRAGELGELTKSGETRVRATDIGKALAWTEGRLTFESVPLRDAIPELARWYDYDFLMANPSLGSRRLTASLGDEPAAEIVRLLAVSLGMHVKHSDRTVTFYP